MLLTVIAVVYALGFGFSAGVLTMRGGIYQAKREPWWKFATQAAFWPISWGYLAIDEFLAARRRKRGVVRES